MLELFTVGCGSGLSGDTLSESGHQWIGLDISRSMLGICFFGFFYTLFLTFVLLLSFFACSHGLFLNGHFIYLIIGDVALENEVEGDLLLGDMGQVSHFKH